MGLVASPVGRAQGAGLVESRWKVSSSFFDYALVLTLSQQERELNHEHN